MQDEDQPLLFTPLVSQAGAALPDWLFGPKGLGWSSYATFCATRRQHRRWHRHHRGCACAESLRASRRTFFSNASLQKSKCYNAGGGAEKLAGRFAAKEAISKALGTGLHGVAWREMEVVQLRSGRPSVRLHGNAKRRAEQLGLSAFDVSIADLAQLSIAIAVGVQTDKSFNETPR